MGEILSPLNTASTLNAKPSGSDGNDADSIGRFRQSASFCTEEDHYFQLSAPALNGQSPEIKV
jgi:hypothetical protein